MVDKNCFEKKDFRVDEVLKGRKLVYSTTNFIKYSLAEALERIADGGFRNVEIWGNIKHLDPRNETEDAAALKALCRRLGLWVSSIHAPFTLDYVEQPGRRMRVWEELVCKSMDQARTLGARLLVVHPVTAGIDDSLQAYREIVERTENSLVKLADIAKDRGIRLAIENMPAHRKRRYGRDVGELYRFISASGRDNLGICLDTGHVIFNNGDAVQEFEQYADRVFSVHMNDNIWGMHMDLHLVPGSGSVDWDRFRQVLEGEKFKGIIVLELDSRGRPSSIFSEACEFVRRYFPDQPEKKQNLDRATGESAK